MEEEEFRRSNLSHELQVLLSSKAWEHALRIVQRVPVSAPAVIPGVHYDLTCSRALFEMIGANAAMARLKHLATPWSQIEEDKASERQKATNRPEWMDGIKETLPPFAQKELERLQNEQQ